MDDTLWKVSAIVGNDDNRTTLQGDFVIEQELRSD
jgi:hypothetical protein